MVHDRVDFIFIIFAHVYVRVKLFHLKRLSLYRGNVQIWLYITHWNMIENVT